MALKPDRKVMESTDISFFMNTTAEKGSVVVLSTVGSGAAMDDSAAVVKIPAQAYGSGEYPLGILLCDVVSGDLTKTHLNYQKDEVQVGSKVTVLRYGTIVTNMIDAGTNPSAGYGAYIGSGKDGKLTSIGPVAISQGLGVISGLSNANPQLTRVGTWLSSKDSDGYAKLDVTLV